MIQQYEVKKTKGNGIVGTIEIKYETKSNIFYGNSNLINRVLTEYGIEKNKVTDYECKKRGNTVTIEITYNWLDLEKIKEKTDKKEQIYDILTGIGYNPESIKEVVYENEYPACYELDTKCWKVTIIRELVRRFQGVKELIENNVSEDITDALGFKVKVNFIGK